MSSRNMTLESETTPESSSNIEEGAMVPYGRGDNMNPSSGGTGCENSRRSKYNNYRGSQRRDQNLSAIQNMYKEFKGKVKEIGVIGMTFESKLKHELAYIYIYLIHYAICVK